MLERGFSQVFNHDQPKEKHPILLHKMFILVLVFVITCYPPFLSHCQHINFSSDQEGIKYPEK